MITLIEFVNNVGRRPVYMPLIPFQSEETDRGIRQEITGNGNESVAGDGNESASVDGNETTAGALAARKFDRIREATRRIRSEEPDTSTSLHGTDDDRVTPGPTGQQAPDGYVGAGEGFHVFSIHHLLTTLEKYIHI